jgi:uncharacterized protein (UPF0332 family)
MKNLNEYLNRLIERGYLKKEAIGLDQIKALLAGARRNLTAAGKTLNIDEETTYAMAYNAMLKIARAIIFLNGYRPDDGQQHKTTVDMAGAILGSDFKELIDKFDRMRRKRNQFTYEPLLPPSRKETEAALKTAKEFYEKVKKYFHKQDPQKKLF